VFHILTTMNRAGLLEGTQYGSHFTDGTPFIPPRPDLTGLQPAEFATARSIAADSATLLRNNGVLPLSRRDLSTHSGGLSVIGPTAVAPYIDGGGS
jgi:beta-glucosidase